MYGTAITACPFFYSKPCDTFRPRVWQRGATRAGLGGGAFVHFFIQFAMLNSLVCEHCSEGKPISIQAGLRHVGLGKSSGIDIADRDEVKLQHKVGRKLVVKIVSAMLDLRADSPDAPLLAGTLRRCERLLDSAINNSLLDHRSGGEAGEILESKVNADNGHWPTCVGCSSLNVNHDIEEPVTARIFRKIRAIPNLVVGNRPAFEHALGLARKANRVALPFKLSALVGHPSEILFTPIARIRPLLLASRLDMLLIHRIDRSGMQAKFFAATASALDQVEAGVPAPTKTQRILLPMLTVISNVIARAALPFKQCVERLHAVTIDKDQLFFLRESLSGRGTNAVARTPLCSESALSLITTGWHRKTGKRFTHIIFDVFDGWINPKPSPYVSGLEAEVSRRHR